MDKIEMERRLNEALLVDIKWRKLSGKELEQLVLLFNDPMQLTTRLGASKAKNLLTGVSDYLLESFKQKLNAPPGGSP